MSDKAADYMAKMLLILTTAVVMFVVLNTAGAFK